MVRSEDSFCLGVEVSLPGHYERIEDPLTTVMVTAAAQWRKLRAEGHVIDQLWPILKEITDGLSYVCDEDMPPVLSSPAVLSASPFLKHLPDAPLALIMPVDVKKELTQEPSKPFAVSGAPNGAPDHLCFRAQEDGQCRLDDPSPTGCEGYQHSPSIVGIWMASDQAG